MKKYFTIKRVLTTSLILGLMGIYMTSLTYTSGAPASNTNAPGESNCTTCHGGSSLQTSGTNFNNVSFSGNFTGGGYIPDSTYTVTLSYAQSGKSKFGFQMTCLTAGNAMAGTITSTSSATSTSTGTVSGSSRTYINQSSSGTSGSGSISWSFQWKAPSSNVDSVTFYSVVNSTNSSGSDAGDIIIARTFKIGPSALLPSADATASASSVCQGTAVALTGAGTNTPTNWQWTLPGGSPNSSTSQNPSVVYNNQGSFNAILRVKNAKGWSTPDTVKINVKPTPTAFVIGTATRIICPGDSVNLIASFDANNTYTWNNGKTGNNIWVKDTGSYQVFVSGANGCGKISNSIQVNHFGKPNATLSSNASIFNDSSCTNNTIILEASGSSFDSFFYYAGNTELSRLATSTFNTNFDSTTTYGLIVKDGNGCTSDLSAYTVYAKEELEAPSIICKDKTASTVTFEWDPSLYHNGFEISTNGGNNWINPSSGVTGNTHQIGNLQPQDSITILLRAKDNAPCFYSKTGTKTCVSDTCSQLQVSVKYNDKVCFGELINFEINGLTGKHYGLKIENGDDFTDTAFSFSSSVSKTFILHVIDSSNLACPANEVSLPIQVDRIYDINLKTNKVTPYCPGETITLTANDTLEQFDFYKNGNLAQSGASNSYSSSNFEDDDSVFVIVKKGKCADTSAIQFINKESPADATFSYERERAVYTFSPTINTYSTYSWDFGDGSAIDKSKNPSHNYAAKEGQSVDVRLEVVTNNNCTNYLIQKVDLPLFSDIEILQALGISVYPNPVEDAVFIANTTAKRGVVYIYTLEGELVSSHVLSSTTTQISTNEFASGVYFLKFDLEGKEVTTRMLKK